MYDYFPTPRGIHGAVEEALKREKELIAPEEKELAQMAEREKLPQNEGQLHSLLMAEGDLAAGELEIPAEWLDNLARAGRIIYLEQGLWIAAEHKEEYALALGDEKEESEENDSSEEGGSREAQLHIVRRMLRYRGGADAVQTAARYGWEASFAESVLEELCQREEAIKQEQKYYHAVLYRRARRRTLQNRREEIRTCPPENYAALVLDKIDSNAPAAEGLQNALRQYAGAAFPVSYWESILLPKRVKNYRESILDAYLAEGELFWHIEEKKDLRFDYLEEVDWDGDVETCAKELTEKERIIYEALLKRGASFLQSLNGLLSGESPYDTLLSLLEKGLVCADSYVPVRGLLEKEKTKKAPVRQRVNLHVKALRAGRWDVVRPVKEPTIEEKIERCFDRSIILCRETAADCNLAWQEALSVLRIWEYTGQARRGYFVEGMSGAQFIRGKDYPAVTRRLQNPEKNIVWINAADPAQCWGKVLPHKEGRGFLNVAGSAVACCGGLPVMVMERQGKTLRVLEEGVVEECLRLFVEEYKGGKIFPIQKRIVVKEYPDTAKEALAKAGFLKEMQDYVLYK